jgi:hypothetical protein
MRTAIAGLTLTLAAGRIQSSAGQTLPPTAAPFKTGCVLLTYRVRRGAVDEPMTV